MASATVLSRFVSDRLRGSSTMRRSFAAAVSRAVRTTSANRRRASVAVMPAGAVRAVPEPKTIFAPGSATDATSGSTCSKYARTAPASDVSSGRSPGTRTAKDGKR